MECTQSIQQLQFRLKPGEAKKGVLSSEEFSREKQGGKNLYVVSLIKLGKVEAPLRTVYYH